MFGSEILEIAIGLSFVFLLASVIATAAKEGLESLLRQRAAHLKKALGELLNGPGGVPGAAGDWVKRFYAHPLIGSLYLGPYDDQRHHNLPSYIPAPSFVATLLDLIGKQAAASARQRIEAEQKMAGATPEQVKAAGDAAAAACQFDRTNPWTSLKRCVEELPDGNLKASLEVVLNETGRELVEIKASLETWFNNSMDRVSGCYKRHSQAMIFIIAAVVTLILNVDTVRIAQKLGSDNALRKALVAQAEVYAKENPAPVSVGGEAAGGKSTNAIPATTTGSTNSPAQQIERTATVIYGLGLPIGWDQFTRPASFGGWLALLGGWLASIFAVSLGAPFWFDLLNKFIRLRGALSPEVAQKKADETKPKKAETQTGG